MSEPAQDGALKQALQLIADARDYMLVIRAALNGITFMPADVAITTEVALAKTVDHITAAIAEREMALRKSLEPPPKAVTGDTVH